MAISQSTLRSYASRTGIQKSAAAISEAKRLGRQTAFLSHSHHDAGLAKGVQNFLQANGWDVYIDWDDTTMPATPDRDTAVNIQAKIVELDWFLFLATENSMRSRWCPWEIGYADGKKPYDSILIIQTKDDRGNYYGNEYLQLYRHLSGTQQGGYAAFGAAQQRGGVILENMRR